MSDTVEPLVSVHMITYNHEPYIAQAIEGVLQQKTSFPIELIIGEDCSTDRTREIVMDYAARYPEVIRVITSEHNVGAHANYQRVLAAARGKYIAFCEGDDYWHSPDKLQLQVDFLEANPEYVLACSNFDLHYPSTNKHVHRNASVIQDYNLNDLPFLVLIGKFEVRTVTVCMYRELACRVIKENPYEFSDEFLMGDTQLWVEASREGRFYYFAQPLATYNILEESASNSSDIKKTIHFRINGHTLVEHYLDKLNLAEERKRTILRSHIADYLFYAFATNDSNLAKKAFSMKKINKIRIPIRNYLYFIGAYYGKYNIVRNATILINNIISHVKSCRISKSSTT